MESMRRGPDVYPFAGRRSSARALHFAGGRALGSLKPCVLPPSRLSQQTTAMISVQVEPLATLRLQDSMMNVLQTENMQVSCRVWETFCLEPMRFLRN